MKSMNHSLPTSYRRWFSFCVLIPLTLLATDKMFAWQMKQAPLMTRWAALVDTNNPLPEYPRPQLVRTNWLNLNGLWQFQAGATNDAVPVGQNLSDQILVPFPMESAISGVMKYHEFSWYRRLFTVPANWNGKKILLHLDAVDWQSTVYVNGHNIGTHKGGYDPITYDITPYLVSGSNELIVQVYSPEDHGGEPRGKQTLYPGGIMYTSSSGIWQPVWLEPVDSSGISDLKIVPDVDNSQLKLTVNTYSTSGVTVRATVLSNGVPVVTSTGMPETEMNISIPHPNLWSPENPFLYDLQVTAVHNGVTNDFVTSYFGMRKISVVTVNGTPQIYLNNQPYFQIGPLDQGFWPDGIYTAPTDDALKYDLEQMKALDFNMVRKHIKVERQRWYYWADKLGLVVWQDMPSCNSYTGNPQPVDARQFIAELTAMVTNHWNSPSIIMWDIFNEGQGQSSVGQTNTPYLVNLVKTIDPSRLVNQASGNDYHDVGDVLDNHSYPAPGDPQSSTQAPVDGEYGGIGFQMIGHLWNPAKAGGNYVGANTTNDIATIYDSFVNDLVEYKSTHGLNAAVYTQITDVENECNGLMTYDRYLKPDLNLIRASNLKAISARAKITTVLPTSEEQGRVWQYTTSAPAANWFAADFDDSAWNSGDAGFGASGTPHAVIHTTWNTSDIWLRQNFVVGALTPKDRTELVFRVFHDEGCEIYINGVLAASATGYTTSYVTLPMNSAAQNAMIANGMNVIAVHCHQTTGGQNIDVGIAKEILVMNSLNVPTDYLGYWPLDETNGTTASDLSGNDNNGTVSGATWNTDGKVNGCLNFNGVNNSVQIANEIGSDFSISFWVKTTQTAGFGQWYQGRCLVDGFTGAGANDFGTSLSGDKFAFGVGDPDTTIESTTPINDGNWHQCVATRQQSDGALALYVDGVLEATGYGGTNPLTAAANLRFGSRQTGANFFFGSLDDIRIYDRALGSNEVTALYLDSVTPAAAPTNLVAVAGNNQATLNWDAVPISSGYDLKRATAAGGPYTLIAGVDGNSYFDSSVTNGTTYYYVVSALNSLGDGTNSAEVRVTPSLDSSLKTWFRADALNLTNGAPVSDWPDVSGNGDDAVQTNLSRQPIFVADAINGFPAIQFQAANSNMLAFARPVQDDFTIFCVFRSTQGYGMGNLYYQGAGLINGEVSGVTDDFGACLFTNGQVCAGTGNPDVAANSAAGFNDGKPHLLTFKRIKSSGEIDLYLDGNLVGSTNGSTSSLTACANLVLGAQQTMIYYLDGEIAEVKIYNSALSDYNRGVEEGALECKYGIAGAGVKPATPTGLTGTPENGSVVLNWPGVSGATTYTVSLSTNLNQLFEPVAIDLTTNRFVDLNAVNGVTNYYIVSAANGCNVGDNSAAIGVFLSNPPSLTLTKTDMTGGALTIGWPVWADGWQLFVATNLTPPVFWSPVNSMINSNNGQFSVTVPMDSGARFFRLAAPSK